MKSVGVKLWATSEINVPNMVHLDIARAFHQYSANISLLPSRVKSPGIGRVIWSWSDFNQCAPVKQIFPIFFSRFFCCVNFFSLPICWAGTINFHRWDGVVGFSGLLLSVLGAGIEFHEPFQPAAEHLGQCLQMTWGDHPPAPSAPHVAEEGSVVWGLLWMHF